MIVEYIDDAKYVELKGLDWAAYFYDRKRNTNIVHELWAVLEQNVKSDFESLYEILRYSYNNRTSRSKIEIYKSKDTIEMTNKGIFPNIMIIRT